MTSTASGTERLIERVLKVNENLAQLKDIDAILDRILYEARKLTCSDAGSIYLVEGPVLRFSYVHNDTLSQGFAGDAAAQYKSFSVPISEESIVGYAAKTGRPVVIDDAYALDDELPYRFNASYDRKSGYRTTSMLTIPLRTFQNRLVGVMQLINAKDPETGASVPFSSESQAVAPLFASNASVAIERGIMTRDMVLRMMKLAELRDPKETGAHVQRVGAYCAEIYQAWAHNRGIARADISKTKDIIRLASMLHDVGKVGIPDRVLKKPGKLDDTEFAIMKWHTVYGARLFIDATSDLDLMCREIALGHHEHWQGGGYPGRIPDLMADEAQLGEPRQGEDIPLAARITALADVYDALCSRRSYKEPWPDEKVLAIIEEDRGKKFDPAIVDVFFEIYDVIKAIREKFKD